MPNIAQYDATGEITPSDRGIQAAEVAGRRLGLYGHELAQQAQQIGDAVERHQAVMETSELYKTGAQLKLNLQQRYEQESALPENRNDPHFGDKFMAEVGPLIDQWGSSVKTDHGKMLAAEMGGQIRNEVFNHVAAGQSEMDSAHVIDNGKTTMNTLGAGLITDPSEINLDRTLGTARDTIDGMTMAIPDVATRERVATELRDQYFPQLVLSRYQGVAESIKNQIAQTGGETSAASEQMDKDIAAQVGFQYLSPEQQSRITEIKDAAVRQGQELFNAKDATQRRHEDEAIENALLPIETGMFQTNAAGGVTVNVTPDMRDAVNRIANMPGAGRHGAQIEALLNAMHTSTQDVITGKERITDHDIYKSLTDRIGSTINPLAKDEVDKMRDKLSESDYSFLRGSASDNKTANPKINQALTELHRWQEQIKPSIDKSNLMSGVDQSGSINFSHFAWDTEHKLRQAIDAGEDPQHAVQRLTDPRNANGFYRYIPQYQRTMSQSMGVIQQMANPNAVQPIPAPPGGVGHEQVAPRKPGESSEDYLKRTSH